MKYGQIPGHIRPDSPARRQEKALPIESSGEAKTAADDKRLWIENIEQKANAIS
jgi:hypothetical protein